MDASDWIPCSRKLPKIEETVLCWLYDDYWLGMLTADGASWYWHFEDFDLEGDDFDDVVAWMPLPDGYKAE